MANVYVPPVQGQQAETRQQNFDPAYLPTGSNVITTGDFNAHTDEVDETLEEWPFTSDVTVLNPGTPISATLHQISQYVALSGFIG